MKTLDAVAANPVLAGAALAEWALGKGSECLSSIAQFQRTRICAKALPLPAVLTQELSTLAYVNSQTLLNASDHSRAIALMNELRGSSGIPIAQLEQQIAQVEKGSPVMEFLAINV